MSGVLRWWKARRTLSPDEGVVFPAREALDQAIIDCLLQIVRGADARAELGAVVDAYERLYAGDSAARPTP